MKKKTTSSKTKIGKTLAEEKQDIKEILELGLKELEDEKYSESSKKFRQIASIIQKMGSITDKKQNYSDRNSLNDLSGKRWLKSTKSWMIYDGKPSDIPKEIKNHPGSFPPDLAGHFIEFFTKTNEWVFDPFMGIGSTLAACAKLNRNCWGVELNPKYADFARKRFQISKNEKKGIILKVFTEDARNSSVIQKKEKIPDVDFVITSPPYFNILKTSRGGVNSTHKKRIKEGFDEKYSENPNDFGNLTEYDDYLDQLTGIFIDMKSIMKDNAYLCIIVQNFRPKNGIMRPLAWDIAYKLRDHYKLRQEFIWLQDQKMLGIWGYPTTYVSNVHHHYCLIFQK